MPAKTQEVMGVFWIQAIIFIQMPIGNKVIRAEIVSDQECWVSSQLFEHVVEWVLDERGVFAGLLVMSAVTTDFECSRSHTMKIPLPKGSYNQSAE